MSKRYKWRVSPSRFESSTGCACFEQKPFQTEYTLAGTNLHEIVEKDLPTDSVSATEAGYVAYCREWLAKIHQAHELAIEIRELKVKECDAHPRGILDYVALTTTGLLIIADWKFGSQRVKPPNENFQLKAYAKMALSYFQELEDAKLPEVSEVMIGIVMPQLQLIEFEEWSLEDVEKGILDCKEINDRVCDPFKEPDASDPDKCSACVHFQQCPLMQNALTETLHKNNMLPIPAYFAPDAIVSDKERIIAQDLAKILETWIEEIRRNNREYASRNNGTIGGVYNMSHRSSGFKMENVQDFAQRLLDDGLISTPDEMFSLVSVSQQGVVNGLLNKLALDMKPGEVKGLVKDAFEELGEEKPPIAVFSRGRGKKVQAIETELDIPNLINPFK